MESQRLPAAQYIRMSTERQDLSPVIQKEAIAAFAAKHELDVVRTYEDDGRSGMRIQNRPALRRLIKDVVDDACFQTVLVYDVSRWGRFQDVDASAYYEYHCRLHGVRVIYIAEPFGDDTSPMTALLKSMKRAAAADFCRDLAVKARAGQHCVISLGFHMGPLPPLGYRRCSVSHDGRSRVVLQSGQRKLALTDRIEWVLAPQAEVALVRRICDAYARTGLELWQIASLVAAEGWRTVRGCIVKEKNLAVLVRNEALIGNFVWGISEQNWKRRIVATPPSRRDGSVPRIIDDETWMLMAERLKAAKENGPRRRALANRTSAPILFGGVSITVTTRRQRSRAARTRMRTRAHQVREFGLGLAQALTSEGICASFDGQKCLLLLWSTRIRIKLLWRSIDQWGELKDSLQKQRDHLLIVRMECDYRPLDFFLVPPRVAEDRFSRTLTDPLPAKLQDLRCAGQRDLMKRFAEFKMSSQTNPS